MRCQRGYRNTVEWDVKNCRNTMEWGVKEVIEIPWNELSRRLYVEWVVNEVLEIPCNEVSIMLSWCRIMRCQWGCRDTEYWGVIEAVDFLTSCINESKHSLVSKVLILCMAIIEKLCFIITTIILDIFVEMRERTINVYSLVCRCTCRCVFSVCVTFKLDFHLWTLKIKLYFMLCWHIELSSTVRLAVYLCIYANYGKCF